jgi:hypothetical protein
MTTSTATSVVMRRHIALYATVGALLGLVRVEGLADPNVLWETRDGLTILSSGHLPRSDTWSWTVHERSWVPNSWGWDVVLGAVHRIAGAPGIAALNVVLAAALVAVIAVTAERLGATRFTAAAMSGVLGGIVLMPWVIVRPQLVSYLFIAAVLPLLRKLVNADRLTYLRWLVIAVAGEVLWINLHFFGVIGPVLLLAGSSGMLALSASRRALPITTKEAALRLGAAVVGTAAACAATPYGAVAASKTVAVHNDAAGLIVEWRPAGFASFSQFTAVLAIACAVPAALHAGHRARGTTVAVLAVLVVGSAIACRIAPALAVVALPEAAAWLSGLRDRAPLRLMGVVIAGVVAVVGVGILVTGLSNIGRLDTRSPKLVADIPRGCRVLNDYPLGGVLIFFRPDLRVSVDSRTDLYGRKDIEANTTLLDMSAHDAASRLQRDRVGCVLAPSSSMLVRGLVADTLQWRSLGEDGTRTLLVRR